LIKNKLAIANIYNNFAWKLSGAELYNAGIDLQTAKALSKKSIDYTAEQMKTPVTDDIARQNLQGTYNNFSDTYGLILFKLGLYDSAFYYQDAIYQQGGQLDAGGLERYAAYAEKVKGSVYTKQVIEQQLLSGVNSPALLKQLQSIYKELNLPNDEFNNIQDKSNQVARQKMEETIKERFGTTEAKNFVLKNIDGQNVSLRSCINKVVVLDFWATWCGPCRASFPATQALINNYKSDSNVVFLFVDVWEHKDAKEMQEAAAKFVKDNNYSFDVLLDTKDKVVDEYKVDGIPTKFVIDKKGEMVFIGNGADDIAGIIEASKK
jgi:thiol-disulfide isomerase/thioredoxin